MTTCDVIQLTTEDQHENGRDDGAQTATRFASSLARLVMSLRARRFLVVHRLFVDRSSLNDVIVATPSVVVVMQRYVITFLAVFLHRFQHHGSDVISVIVVALFALRLFGSAINCRLHVVAAAAAVFGFTFLAFRVVVGIG